ncbi:MAG: PD-(D/E)XK nuclease family protein [Acidimicrobiales bacterium]
MVSVSTTAFGAAAIDRLARTLDEQRDGDPLAPAIVVVQRSLQAVAVRRALGRRPGGVAAVEVVTVDQLIDRLVTPSLAAADLRPISDLELQSAIRAELAAMPGRFGNVASHRATEDRIVALYRQIDGVGYDALDRLAAAGSGLAGDAIRVIRNVGRRQGVRCDRNHLVDVAIDELGRLPAGALGPIVLHLPDPAHPVDGRLVSAIARRPDGEVIVGLTGDRMIDRQHLSRLAGWSIQIDAPASVGASSVDVKTATVLEVADPDDEVRAALADVGAHAALGVPLNRMAVLYTAADPYASLLSEQLGAARLPWCGPGRRPLAASVAGRFLLRLLGLQHEGLDRASVMALLTSAPITYRDKPIPLASWDRLSRQAGVVDGDQWVERLAELTPHLDADDAADIEALGSFVSQLQDRLGATATKESTTWSAHAAWARALLDELLPGTDDWPADERAARVSVEAILEAIERLDATARASGTSDPTTVADVSSFASLVAAELDRERMAGRPLGDGLVVAPLGEAAGLDFERVIVIGLADGVFPRSPRDDSLLPNKLRAESNGLLPAVETIADLDLRQVAAALAGSRTHPLAITARGDLRSIRSRSWPRALDPLVEDRVVLPSHHRVLADHGRPASVGDLRLRALIAHVDGGEPVHTHQLAGSDPALAATLRRVRNRAKPEMNRHVGLVPAGVIDHGDRLLSATALEAYASCPRSYLLGRVLRLGDDERPERIDDITPADRGTLMHAVLERFIAEALEAGEVPVPGERWPLDERGRIRTILDEEIEQAQARGITGGRVNTHILRRRMRAEIELFLDTDDRLRAERGSTPLTVEIGFGIDDEPSTVVLPDGRALKLRGRVDRVDATDDGGLLVIDYKGGSGRAFAGMDDDPLDGGRRLQLPLYARVAAEKLGRDGPRTALYWLTKFGDVKPMELEEELESALDRTVGAALDGITDGLFPGVPGEAVGWPRLTFANCRYCDFDRICPTDRQGEWEGVRDDPALEPIEPLIAESGDR